MALPQTWGQFATAMLPALRAAYAGGMLPAWWGLALAAHESGVPVAADSTYAIQRNPWGVRPWAGESYPASNDFVVYPSLQAAGADLIGALGPARLALIPQGASAFLANLQATGWDGPAPASNGYADSVLDTFGPLAQSALAALGLNLTTAEPPGTGAAGAKTGGDAITPAAVAVPVGLLAGVAALVLVAEYGVLEGAVSLLRRLFAPRKAA